MLILFPFIYAFPCLFFLAFTTFYFLFIQFILCFLLFLFFSIIFYCSIYAILLALSLNFFSLSTFSCTFQILFLFFSTPFIYVMSKRGTFCSKFCLCLPTRVSSQRHRAHLTLSHPTCITGVQSALASDG